MNQNEQSMICAPQRKRVSAKKKEPVDQLEGENGK